MIIPEIDLELNPGTLGGRFTTLEGLLQQVYEELDEKVFANGDAAVAGAPDEMGKFLAQLKLVSPLCALLRWPVLFATRRSTCHARRRRPAPHLADPR